MLEIFKTVLSSDSGSFGFGAGIVLLLGWIVYKATRFITRIECEHGGFCKRVDSLDSNTEKLLKDMAYIKGALDVLRIPNIHDLIRSNSPVSLTPLGMEVANELGAAEIISKNWHNIYNRLNTELTSVNAYDIQQHCLETASVEPELFFDKEDVDKIKLFSFVSGQPFQLYAKMMGIIIRDRYFSVKGISVEDIITNSPKK